MAEIIEFPKQPDRSKLIDALLDIRLTLTNKKLVSDYIKKSEFKKILSDEKHIVQDNYVSLAIDDLFKEYFEIKPSMTNDNESLSINQMENIIDNEIYQDSGNGKGRSLIKTDGHYKTSAEGSSNPDSKAA